MGIDKHVTYILGAIKDVESSIESNRAHSVPVVLHLALCFLATKSFESPVGDKAGIKQYSMSNNLALFLVVELKKTQLNVFTC